MDQHTERRRDGSIDFAPSPPSPWFSAAELVRASSEAATLIGLWPFLDQLPSGDGHPVFVLPGFAAGDGSTWLLRRFLVQKNYRAIPWRLGTNTGSPELQERLVRRMVRLQRTYREPISIIGQSLGGVFARELARRFPQAVRQVITLGSPFGATSADSTNPMVLRLFEQLSGLTIDQMRDMMPGGETPTEAVGVPCTSVFSRSDGVVQWQACVEAESPTTENVEVVASHSGMSMNAVVFDIVADRLAQPAGRWRKLDKERGWRRITIPNTSAC